MIQNAFMITLTFWLVHAVDRSLSWQTLNRPIVVSFLIGLLLGDVRTGIIMGASLEAIFMGISPIGGSIPSDPTGSSIIAVAFTIISGSDIETGLAIAMPIGILMASFDSMYRTFLALMAPYWERLAATGDTKKFAFQSTAFGLIFDRLAQALVLFLAVAFGIEGLQAFLAGLPTFITNGLAASGSMMTAVGFAILTSMIWSREVGGFFFVGFVLSKYMNLGPLPIAILAAVVAMAYFYNDKKLVDLKRELASEPKEVGEEFF